MHHRLYFLFDDVLNIVFVVAFECVRRAGHVLAEEPLGVHVLNRDLPATEARVTLDDVLQVELSNSNNLSDRLRSVLTVDSRQVLLAVAFVRVAAIASAVAVIHVDLSR